MQLTGCPESMVVLLAGPLSSNATVPGKPAAYPGRLERLRAAAGHHEVNLLLLLAYSPTLADPL